MKAKYYIIISLVLIGCKKDPIDNDIVDKIDNTETISPAEELKILAKSLNHFLIHSLMLTTDLVGFKMIMKNLKTYFQELSYLTE